MSNIAIRVENLSKLYHIGASQAKHDTLRDALANLFRRRNTQHNSDQTALWALRDVSFEVQRGEVVGIIGRNGAGKSTLLKILSRITEPSSGRAQVFGRVGSLLEVGTGFHPELTGRENVYLNGAILGMKRTEIDRKFDEIVDFSGLERFLDTPVKRYSSGMYVRLAFAVAAHLEPEILLVDEVLAVGDAAFQKKCIGKMGEVAGEGRTVLVVSHNMGTIESLCDATLLLNQGTIGDYGEPAHLIRIYLRGSGGFGGQQGDLRSHENRLPGMFPALRSVLLLDAQGNQAGIFPSGEMITVRVGYDASQHFESLAGAGFILTAISGTRVGGFNTYMGVPPPHRIPNRGTVEFAIKAPALVPGDYSLTVSLGSHQNHLVDKIEDVISFSVTPNDIYRTGYLLTAPDGLVALDCKFTVGE